MDSTSIITAIEQGTQFAYSLIPFAALYGYAPMIFSYWKKLRDGTLEDCTTQAYGWLMWLVCNGIATLYATLIIFDVRFIFVSSANFLLSATACVLAFWVARRYKQQHQLL